MSYEPTVYCRNCSVSLDAYVAYEERFCCDECEKQDDDFRNRHRFLLEEMDKLRSENEKLKESLKQIADWSSPTNTPPTKSTLLPLLETSMIAINRIIKEALK